MGTAKTETARRGGHDGTPARNQAVRRGGVPGEAASAIVGIGASAGGLDALKAFVRAAPSGAGLAYIVVQHLSPDHESMLESLLGTHATIPVRTASHGMRIDPDTITVGPAGVEVRLRDGTVELAPLTEKGRRTPIDTFFASLAEHSGSGALCVVLSGTGSDGTAGLRAVKAAGGVAVVQERTNARFPGMPDSALATGLIDFVLPAHAIPARLIDIVHHRRKLRDGGDGDALRAAIEEELPRIREILGEGGEGWDFGQYKPGTLVRRIERRMNLLRQRTVEGFVHLLGEDAEERTRLRQDFLIGVTRFFRDPQAFEALDGRVIDPLLARGPERVRIWVPGCSTGEEVYSIAMLCWEARLRHGAGTNVQVFGTDIDQAALMFARQGVYSSKAVEDVSPARRATHFIRENGDHAIAPALRELCVFAPHNVLNDPPFSRLDLVSCRNLLIYLDRHGQARAMARFHYALNDDAHLFLSPAEALGSNARFFDPVDKEHRIFRRDGTTPRAYSATADESQPHRRRRTAGAWSYAPPPSEREPERRSLGERAERFFLDRFAAPYAVIDARNEVVYLSERMTEFARPAQGETSTKIEDFLLPALRLPVRAALAAVRGNGDAMRRTVVVGEGEAQRLVGVEAADMPDGFVMVTLRELAQPATEALSAQAERQSAPERAALERELSDTRQQLDVTLAEYELSSEELRSTNEELLSMNEEMQTANEELETSREELQSVNEELETMNAELWENNKQLGRANSDLKNLLVATQIATLFLDHDLCVRGFTPEITELFGMRQRDEGRPVSDLAQRFSHDGLVEDAEEVRRTLQMIEREVEVGETGRAFVMRVRPYRTIDDRLDGFVLTFFDITERKRAERLLDEQRRDLQRQYDELETLYDTTPVGLSLMDRELRWIRINQQLADINGFPIEAHIGVRQTDLIPDIDERIAAVQRRVLDTGEAVMGIEVHGYTPAEPDRPRDWVTDYYPVTSGGEVFAVGCCVREVTEQKALERNLQLSLERMELAVVHHPIFMAEIDADERLVWLAGRMDGFPDEDAVGRPVFEVIPEKAIGHLRGVVGEVRETGRSQRVDVPLDDGARRTFEVSIEPMRGVPEGGDGEARGLFLLWFDVTDRRRAEDRRTLLLGELQHRVKNTLATVLSLVRFAASMAEDISQMEQGLTERLLAISRTHDHLTRNDWTEVSVAEIVHDEVDSHLHRPDMLTTEGLDRKVSPRHALALALALHELTVNAAKHGSLSIPRGRLRIAMRREGGMIRMVWQESHGPAIEGAPPRTGFGSFLLRQALPYQVDGEATLEFRTEGLRFELVFPADGDGGWS